MLSDLRDIRETTVESLLNHWCELCRTACSSTAEVCNECEELRSWCSQPTTTKQPDLDRVFSKYCAENHPREVVVLRSKEDSYVAGKRIECSDLHPTRRRRRWERESEGSMICTEYTFLLSVFYRIHRHPLRTGEFRTNWIRSFRSKISSFHARSLRYRRANDQPIGPNRQRLNVEELNSVSQSDFSWSRMSLLFDSNRRD